MGLNKVSIAQARIAPGLTNSLSHFLPQDLISTIKEKRAVAPSYQGKSILDLIGEAQARFSFSTLLSQSFLDFLPEIVKTALGLTYGELMKNFYPFNATLISLLPETWQKTLKEAFNLTDEDIETAIEQATEKTKRQISSILADNLEWFSKKFVQVNAKVFNKKFAEKISKNVLTEENLKKVNENMTKVLEPIIERAIKKPFQEGFLMDSLNEINLGD